MTTEKRIGPKTQPTGRPTGTRKAETAPDEESKKNVVIPKTAEEVSASNDIRLAYVYFRRRAEWLRSGATGTYRPPKLYDGKNPVRLEEADSEIKGGILSPGHIHEWYALLAFCQKNGLDPLLYVAIVFDSLTLDQRLPEPATLRSGKYLKLWEEQLVLYAQNPSPFALALLSEVQKSTARINYLTYCWKKATKWSIYTNVLTDKTLGLSSLFCYCLSCSIATEGGSRFRRMAKDCEVSAILQFEPYREYYLKDWNLMLPSGFAESSTDLFRQILTIETEE